MSPAKPVVVIVEGATGVTGGFMAAKREAECLRDLADVVLVIPEGSGLRPADLSSFSEVVRLPIRPLRRSFRSALTYLPSLVTSGRKLARLLKDRSCTRLQINDYYLMHDAVARLFGYRGRILTWVRIDPAIHGSVAALWLRIARAVSGEVVTVSKHLKSSLPRRFEARVVYDPVVQIPVPSDRTRSSRFVFFGNFIEGKGQDVAIRAFDRIVRDFPDAELAFYGSDMGLPKNRSYLQGLTQMAAASSAHDRIAFNGFVEDVTPVLSSAFAALNLSWSESFSLTCQEASASGLPVIATRSGGPVEIIEEGVTGFLVPVGDVDAIADRMRTLLSDPERAREMGRRGSELVRERFPVDAFRGALIDILRLDR